jgi:hypothetical protein
MKEVKIDPMDWVWIAVVFLSGIGIACFSAFQLENRNLLLDGLQGSFFVSALIVGWRAYIVAKNNLSLTQDIHLLNKKRAASEERVSRRNEVRNILESKISSKVTPVPSFNILKKTGFTFEEIYESLKELSHKYYTEPGPERKLSRWEPLLRKVFEDNNIELESFSEQISDSQENKQFFKEK